MYSDIVGFTSLCSESEPLEVVTLRKWMQESDVWILIIIVNGMFTAFDNVINAHQAYVGGWCRFLVLTMKLLESWDYW